jgi:hypothetical protein
MPKKMCILRNQPHPEDFSFSQKPSGGDRFYIGIDPGASGGLVLLDWHGIMSAMPMPKTERDIWNWFHSLFASGLYVKPQRFFAVIEKVGGFIKGKQQPGARMFSFGAGYGGLRMALIASSIPFVGVTPQKWQRALGIPKRAGEEKAAYKDRLRALAQQLYPGFPLWEEPRSKGKQLAISDALLIATYAKKSEEGLL